MAAALATVGLAARPAAACSPFTNEAYATDPGQGGDTTPPGEVAVSATFAAFARDANTMCAWAGDVTMDAAATDDVTPAADLGYQVRALQGALQFPIPTGPITRGLAGHLVFYTARVDLDLIFEVRAVDRAGNLGPPTRLLVPHPIVDDGGCSTGGGGGLGGALAVLGLLTARCRGTCRRGSRPRNRRAS